jgi:hypothetical protein
MTLPFVPPLYEFGIAGPEETKNLTGKVLRPIQIRLATPSFEKIAPTCQINSTTGVNRRFKFNKRRQLSSARTMKRLPSRDGPQQRRVSTSAVRFE